MTRLRADSRAVHGTNGRRVESGARNGAGVAGELGYLLFMNSDSQTRFKASRWGRAIPASQGHGTPA